MEQSSADFISGVNSSVPTASLMQELASLKTQEVSLLQLLDKYNIYLNKLKVQFVDFPDR